MGSGTSKLYGCCSYESKTPVNIIVPAFPPQKPCLSEKQTLSLSPKVAATSKVETSAAVKNNEQNKDSSGTSKKAVHESISENPNGRGPPGNALTTKVQELQAKEDNLTESAYFVIRKTKDVTKDYSILKEIGHGQFGVVSIAVEKSTGCKHAIKTMSKRKASSDSEFRRDTRIEVEIMYHLVGHRNIVALHDVYEDRDGVHLVMELCQGGDWFSRLIEGGTYSEVHAATTVRSILKALAYCHSLGVVHRDIKPENMIYYDRAEDSPIKLADFGLSAMMPRVAMSDLEGNISGKEGLLYDTVGTPYYVAPEILENCGYGPKCDIWSMGVVIYIALGGYPPFNGGNQQQVFYAIKYKPLTFDRESWSDISESAKDLIRRMLVKDPSKRATISEILAHPWMSLVASKMSQNKVPDAVVARLHQFSALNQFKKEARKILASLLPEEEVLGLLKIFQDMDSDGNGVLSLQELVAGLSRKGVKLPEDQAKVIMRCADINGDGILDYTEFLAGAVHQSRLEKDDLLFKAFSRFDTDNCGYIKPKDLREALKDHRGKVDLETILEEIDTDHDGCINYEEFCNCLKKKDHSKSSFGSLRQFTMRSALSLVTAEGCEPTRGVHQGPANMDVDQIFQQMFGSR